MERYDYKEHEIEDIKSYIKDHEIEVTADNRDEIEEQLNEDLFAYDGVTGNASGSYTFNTWEAEENICHNLDLLGEALNEMGYYGESMQKAIESAETCDVLIRCYLLPECLSKALDELEKESVENEEVE